MRDGAARGYTVPWLVMAASCLAAIACVVLLDEPRELCSEPEACEIPFEEL